VDSILQQVWKLSSTRQALLRCWLDGEGGGGPATDRRRLVAWVVPRGAGARESYGWDEQVQQWRDVHDALYLGSQSATNREFNTTGWLSSYDSVPIPADEMQEWRDETVSRILECKPERILEIGCGMGLLLFPLASLVLHYLGTDVSPVGLESIRCSGVPRSVELRQQAAHDFSGIEPGSFDTIILNSVIQYFPDVHYLFRVLEQAWRSLRPGGHLFIGDIRNLDLLTTFHVTVAMHRGSRSETVASIQRKVARAVEEERELALAPVFFDALAKRLPDLTALEIQPKRGRACNELTRFRYDAILRHGGHAAASPSGIELDYYGEGWSVGRLRAWMQAEQPELVTVRSVPVSRLAQAVHWTELLSDAQCPPTAGELSDAVPDGEPVDVENLVVPGYDMRLRYSAEPGAYDVIVQRGNGPLFELPRSIDAPPETFANDPLRPVRMRQLAAELKSELRDTLPAYMVPSSFVFIDTMPRTANGKVDRAALALPEDLQATIHKKLQQPPRNESEARLAEIWEEVLGCRCIGVTDNFFDLGGHSLLATQLISRVRRAFGVEVPLRSLFDAPTIEAQAIAIEDLLVVEIDKLSEEAAKNLAEGGP
jgi:SAM-dependent methyltransferase/acyl carrier protein